MLLKQSKILSNTVLKDVEKHAWHLKSWNDKSKITARFTIYFYNMRYPFQQIIRKLINLKIHWVGMTQLQKEGVFHTSWISHESSEPNQIFSRSTYNHFPSFSIQLVICGSAASELVFLPCWPVLILDTSSSDTATGWSTWYKYFSASETL